MSKKATKKQIKHGIDKINEAAKALQGKNWKKLSQDLHDLRKSMHDFEYWLDEEIRVEAEAVAVKKAKDIIAAKITFEEIVIDRVALFMKDGEIIIGEKTIYAGPPLPENQEDDDCPF